MINSTLEREYSPSMSILMNRICIALSGLLRPKSVLSVINVRAAAAVLSWKARKFWMLWNMDLPATSRVKPVHDPLY